MTIRKGPTLTLVGSCDGCKYRTTLRTHKIQYACDNREGIYGKVPRIIGGAQKATPAWCPELQRATREYVRAVLAKEGET